jgi:predicted nuclease of restriction endonuclease-like RecB superfamily
LLTADLVEVRRKGSELQLPPVDAKKRARAEEIAAHVIAAAGSCVGRTREELEQALTAVDVGPREVRLRDGLVKLFLDGCTFDEGDADEAERVRREVFVRAAAARRAHRFDRARVLEEAAGALGKDAAWVERTLYSDLAQSHVLLAVPAASASTLASAWEAGRVQAVLLRATRVAIDVRASAPVVRALCRKLKFLRLLYTITREGEGHRVVVDGPMSLFESATKYGLQLALLVPALDACDAYAMVAEVRWGKERTPLLFRWSGGLGDRAALAAEEDDVLRELREGLAKLASGWSVKAAKTVLDLPGEGLCVPDLTLEKGGARVHVEVLGFWSRDAVWRRVELAQKGLPEPVVFCISSRLRVSEAALPDEVPASLYVYKGVMSPRALLEKIEAVARRTAR